MPAQSSLDVPQKWVELFPWLEYLGARDVLALQRLGGPVEWWCRESVAETTERRAEMDDVYELLSDLLTITPQVDCNFRYLMQTLPWSWSISDLRLESRAEDALTSVGLATLDDLSGWTPDRIMSDLPLRPRETIGVFAHLLLVSTIPNGSQQQVGAEDRGDTQPLRRTPEVSEVASFTQALQKLSVYAHENGIGNLRSLLLRHNQLPRGIGELVQRILDATPSDEEPWTLGGPVQIPATAGEPYSYLTQEECERLTQTQHRQGADTADTSRQDVFEADGETRVVATSEQLAVDDTTDEALGTKRSGRRSLKERAYEVLDLAGHPLVTQILAEQIGDGVNIRSLKVQLAADNRFMRSDVDAWALTDWEMRPYTSIKELVAEEVDRAGGYIASSDLIQILTTEFSINESSVRQVASSPPFTARGGVVRRLVDGRPATTKPTEQTKGSGAQTENNKLNGSDTPDDEGPSTDDLMNLMGI